MRSVPAQSVEIVVRACGRERGFGWVHVPRGYVWSILCVDVYERVRVWTRVHRVIRIYCVHTRYILSAYKIRTEDTEDTHQYIPSTYKKTSTEYSAVSSQQSDSRFSL